MANNRPLVVALPVDHLGLAVTVSIPRDLVREMHARFGEGESSDDGALVTAMQRLAVENDASIVLPAIHFAVCGLGCPLALAPEGEPHVEEVSS